MVRRLSACFLLVLIAVARIHVADASARHLLGSSKASSVAGTALIMTGSKHITFLSITQKVAAAAGGPVPL